MTGGADLPKMSDWADKLVKNLLERIETDPVPDVRLDALEALGHTTQPGVPEVSEDFAPATASKLSRPDRYYTCRTDDRACLIWPD